MAAPASPPSAHVVGNMFVEQYYSILHHKPEEVYKFYKDSSILSRPGLNGEMKSVTTMQAIDETIRSLDYGSYKVVIGTVDAQHSYQDGVIVLVTGCLTGKGNKALQKFTQSFFLAPQENGGFFVLNDVFRYVSDSQLVEINHIAKNVTAEVVDAPVDSVPEPSVDHVSHTPDPITVLPEKSKDNEEIQNPIENESQADDAVSPVNTSTVAPDIEVITADPVVQEDAPKKSYAYIVKVVKGSSTMPSKSSMPVSKAEVLRVTTEKQVAASATPPPETSVTDSNNAANSNPPEDVEGYSIYVSNLPRNATPYQLEAEFKKFGPIKPGGVQVRNHKNGFCFGFVEFESLSSMQSALEVSPIVMGGRQLVVEEKKTRTRVGSSNGSSTSSGRGRFPLSRGGFRNDNFRGRGGLGGGGGQGYGRTEFRSRGEFSNRGRGPSVREGYQRVGRPDVVNTAGVSA